MPTNNHVQDQEFIATGRGIRNIQKPGKMDILDILDSKKEEIRNYFDCVSHRYESDYDHTVCQWEDESVRSWLLENIRHDENVLDIGCGTGAFIRFTGHPQEHYCGIDISAGMLAVAAKNYPEHWFREQDFIIAETPKIFNVVVSLWGAINYMPLNKAVDNIASALLPGGSFFGISYTHLRHKRNIGNAGIFAHYNDNQIHEHFSQKFEQVEVTGFSYPLVDRVQNLPFAKSLFRTANLAGKAYPNRFYYHLIKATKCKE